MIDSDYKKSIFIFWSVISTILIAVIICPYVFTESSILSYSPKCYSKLILNQDCALCGMTRGFIQLSKGNVYSAITYNQLSPFIFFFFVMNSIYFLTFLVYVFRIKSVSKSTF